MLPELDPIFHDHPDGICPFSFPVLVSHNRDRLVKELRRRGVFFDTPWVRIPFTNVPNLMNSDEPFDDAKFVSDRILSLPIHQGLTTRSLEKASDVLKKLL